MKIAILGFGREGKSVFRFLQNRGTARNERGKTQKNFLYKSVPSEIWILDKNPKTKIPRGVKSQLGKNYLRDLEKFDIVFRSPGIPYNLPELKKARRAGAKFSSATEIFFDNCPAKIIGVTGTKGKGTTSTLLYKILKTAGKKVFLAGNIGKPMLDILPQLGKNDLVILELSSFQLQDLKQSPAIAAVLNVFPDHQDAHENLKEYYEAKANIARFQKKTDKIFFFENNPVSRLIAAKSKGKKISVNEKKFKLFGPEDLKIKGWHNFQNAAMATTIARSLGVSPKTILKVVKNFRGLEHRLELIRIIQTKYSGSIRDNSRKIREIKFYDDSASTNPQTAAASIKAFPDEPKILIAGGQDKNLDYKPLAQALKNSETKLVVLFGENKKKIYKEIRNGKLEIRMAKDLSSAVQFAYKTAQRLISHFSSPISIIFSPGAASFDMFRDYGDRGRQFKKIVKNLTR